MKINSPLIADSGLISKPGRANRCFSALTSRETDECDLGPMTWTRSVKLCQARRMVDHGVRGAGVRRRTLWAASVVEAATAGFACLTVRTEHAFQPTLSLRALTCAEFGPVREVFLATLHDTPRSHLAGVIP